MDISDYMAIGFDISEAYYLVDAEDVFEPLLTIEEDEV